jgi:hypothetical protein
MTTNNGMTGGRHGGYRPESTFSGGDREPRVTDGMPLVQWAHNWVMTEKGRKGIYSGFALPHKRDEALDKLLTEQGWRTFQMTQTEGVVNYWATESMSGVEGALNLFFVTLGLDTSDNMVQTLDRKGWGYAFHPTGGTSDKGRPLGVGKLNTIAFVAELVKIGYTKPVLVTASKTTALSLNTVAIRNYNALDKLHDLLKANSDDPNNVPYPAYYLLAVEIVPGAEKKVGQGAESRTLVPPWSGLPTGGFKDEAEAKKWISARFIRNVKQYGNLLDLIEVAPEDSEDGLALLDKSLENAAGFAKLFASKGDDWWKSETSKDQADAETAVSRTPGQRLASGAQQVAAAADDDAEMWGAPPARTAAPTAAQKAPAASPGQRAQAKAATTAVAQPTDDDLF